MASPWMTLPTVPLLLMALLLTATQTRAANEEFMQREPTAIADFKLSDQSGAAFGLEQLKGQWTMLVLGFTSCPDVCPMTLMRLEAIRAQLGLKMMPDSIPEIVFVAVDPDRDQTILKDYLAHFHPEYIGLTGDHSELKKLVESIDGMYRIEKRYPGEVNYTVKHSAGVALINPEGEWIATLNPPFHSHRTSEFLVQVIRHDNASQHARNE